MKAITFWIAILIALSAHADYLMVNRNTTIKTQPVRGAAKVIGGELKAGELLELLDSAKQTNAHYRVKIMGTSIEGWIYRSLARKMPGELPRFLADAEGVEVHIVDVGAGLGCIIRTPDDKYIIYDGGNGHHVHKYLRSIYPTGNDIELVIASHTDSDHWEGFEPIARDYNIKNALITSYRPDGLPTTVENGKKALEQEPGIYLRDLVDYPTAPDSMIYDDHGLKLRFLSGFGDYDSLFGAKIQKDASKLRNAASIVIKLEYAGRSVLFTGDAVGLEECEDKQRCDCDYTCISTEKFLLDTVSHLLESDVIIAPHHGARNASCPDFIEAVNADYAIFSAGNSHKHPHKLTAMNYQSYGGIPADQLLRTD